MTSQRAADIDQLLAPALAPLGLVVEDVTVTPAGKRRVVRVLVDRELSGLQDETSPVPPLDLDLVADATRAVSDRLDSSDLMGDQPYVLEVSSTGVDRPLTQPRHFRRNVGRLLTATLADGSQVEGRLERAGERDIDVAVAGADGSIATRTIPYADLGRVRVNVEFSRAEPADDEGKDR
ncbi:ribosome maturation factor RimP [Calidifontibacter sp. DB0510]|uniref:Ribosome maturation factor RimP n=1 Tax=Metallococcus carri TaxID=1656884 RepID=A0A967AXK6_9MICO|nr:ribosome maturation factor RimP [Metallococcus carri]NHN54279.1 ribosome maturation factor RimP [Metallococcus carri]NOP36881.1 ribosome maturation factor RimP [Calidifontibacter sp. DB2511S]